MPYRFATQEVQQLAARGCSCSTRETVIGTESTTLANGPKKQATGTLDDLRKLPAPVQAAERTDNTHLLLVMDKSIARDEKTTEPRALPHVLAIVVMVPLWLWIASATLPVFIKVLLPFPELSDAQLLAGVIRHETPLGSRPGVDPPVYFIDTDAGSRPIYCGYYRLDRGWCIRAFGVHGTKGRVWMTPLHGVIQFDVQTVAGQRFAISREDIKRGWIDHFPWSKYRTDMLLLAFVSAYLVYKIYLTRKALSRSRRIRQAVKSVETSSPA